MRRSLPFGGWFGPCPLVVVAAFAGSGQLRGEECEQFFVIGWLLEFGICWLVWWLAGRGGAHCLNSASLGLLSVGFCCEWEGLEGWCVGKVPLLRHLFGG